MSDKRQDEVFQALHEWSWERKKMVEAIDWAYQAIGALWPNRNALDNLTAVRNAEPPPHAWPVVAPMGGESYPPDLSDYECLIRNFHDGPIDREKTESLLRLVIATEVRKRGTYSKSNQKRLHALGKITSLDAPGVSPALAAAAPELYKCVKAAWHTLQSVIAVRDGIPDEELRSIAGHLAEALAKADGCSPLTPAKVR